MSNNQFENSFPNSNNMGQNTSGSPFGTAAGMNTNPSPIDQLPNPDEQPQTTQNTDNLLSSSQDRGYEMSQNSSQQPPMYSSGSIPGANPSFSMNNQAMGSEGMGGKPQSSMPSQMMGQPSNMESNSQNQMMGQADSNQPPIGQRSYQSYPQQPNYFPQQMRGDSQGAMSAMPQQPPAPTPQVGISSNQQMPSMSTTMGMSSHPPGMGPSQDNQSFGGSVGMPQQNSLASQLPISAEAMKEFQEKATR